MHNKESFPISPKKSERRSVDFNDFPDSRRLDSYPDIKKEVKGKLDPEESDVKWYAGHKVYPSDDPGEMYKIVKKKKPNLLELTSDRDRVTLLESTYVMQNGKRYKAGFTMGDSIVKRKKDSETGKWIIKQSLNPYIALSIVKFSFISNKSGDRVIMTFEPGETFWAPKSGEKKDKRRKNKKQV